MKKFLFNVYGKIKRFYKSQLPHYKTVNKYWVQKIPCKKIENRLDFFIKECKNKDIIHFGCTDWPVFNPDNNLHIKLSKHTKSIDGFDIDLPGIENLRNYVNQDYYSDFNNLPQKKYHVCLIPETIEHVDNVRNFLENISTVNADKFFITAPNCFSKSRRHNYYLEKDSFVEVVHPDHNSWFSPYTLKNTIEKYSSLEVVMTYLLEGGKMVCCEAKKK